MPKYFSHMRILNTVASGLLALSLTTPAIYAADTELGDGVLDLEDPTTKKLIEIYLREYNEENRVNEADDEATDGDSDESAEEIEADEESKKPEVEPIVNPPIQERPFYPTEELFQLYPETVFTLSDDEEAEAVPIFDEIGESAKDEYVKGAILLERGFSSQALNHYLKAVERDPENLWLKNKAAQICLQQSDFSRATKFAEEVLEADESNHTAMHTLATIDYYRDRLDDAKDWYKKILEEKPGNIKALESLARIAYINDRDYEATKEYCAQIMEISNRNLNAILWYAEANAITGEIKHAADLYEQLVHYRPSLINRLADMAGRLIREGRETEAEELLKQGVIMRPQSRLVVLQWEKLVLQRGGIKELDDEYIEMVEANHLDLKIRETYCDFLVRERLTGKLRAQRIEMLDLNPRHTPSLLSLAKIELEEDDLEGATEYFDKALSTAYNDPEIHRNVGLIYLENGKREKAVELLTTAAFLDPEDAQTLIALAALAEEDEDLDKAERMLKLALDASPADRDILGLLASLYKRTERNYEASQMLEQITAIDPTDVNNQVNLAILYMEMEDSAGLDRLQKMAPNQVNQKLNFFTDYGAVSAEYGHFDRAAWSLEKALQISPAAQPIRALYAETLLHLDQKERAEEVLLRGRTHVKDGTEKEADFLVQTILFYLKSSQYEKAKREAEELLKLDEQKLYYYDLYFRALSRIPNSDEDMKDAMNQMVLTFAAEQPIQTKILRSEALSYQKQYKRAISVLRPLLEEPDADTLSLKFAIADLYGSAGELESAESYYDQIIAELEETPNAQYRLASALNNFAYLLSKEGVRLDEAERMAVRADELNPRQDFILDTLGWIKYQKKELFEAEQLLLKAYHYSLGDSEIAEHLAVLYEEMGKPNKALEYYEKAYEVDPTNDGWADKIEELTKTIGQVMDTTAEPITP